MTALVWTREKGGWNVTTYTTTVTTPERAFRVTISPTGARRGLGLDWRATTGWGAASITLDSGSTLRAVKAEVQRWADGDDASAPARALARHAEVRAR